MFNHIRNKQLLKTIRSYSDLEHPVSIEDVSALRKRIREGIIVCKELIKRCNNIEEAECLYNKACLSVHLKNY